MIKSQFGGIIHTNSCSEKKLEKASASSLIARAGELVCLLVYFWLNSFF